MSDQPLILIVDDDPNFREIFSVKLSAAGFRTETADGGEAGIEKVKSLHPNLVLMDVNMPIMDGPTTFMKLHEDPATKDVRVAFLTNLGDPRLDLQEVDKKFSADFGAQAYLKKTDSLDALVGQVKTLLGS